MTCFGTQTDFANLRQQEPSRCIGMVKESTVLEPIALCSGRTRRTFESSKVAEGEWVRWDVRTCNCAAEAMGER